MADITVKVTRGFWNEAYQYELEKLLDEIQTRVAQALDFYRLKEPRLSF